MGVQRWQPKLPALFQNIPAPVVNKPELQAQAVITEEPAIEAITSDASHAAPPVVEPAQMGEWPELESAVRGCRACELHQSRTQTVFGVGAKQADCMIIGETPGADEDRQGEPFVGKAGQLLNAMIQAIGLSREQVFIANILKCRPPGNRNPSKEEVAACSDFLDQQITLVKPKVILSVGRISAQNLLKTDVAVGKLRGLNTLPGHDIPLVVTYHPAYLLRTPSQKRAAWADMKLLRSLLVSAE
ncbi:MAG: uracil-DNA glycosylase [Methylococcales bacterium]|jgi:uracil-DNA glycosylase|nr:uracil-DNA glycosylase [Methylococcales bacterium]MBT7442526.1 uracil-DNA glycosylase [Methylococcales bacterium]